MRGPAEQGILRRAPRIPRALPGRIQSRPGPVVKGFGQAGSGTPRERETVANDLDRAGVNRDINRAAWAERTICTRRKNRRGNACSRKSDLRRNLDRGRRNVEAGWSQGWPPGIAQHDLQTLKGTKPQERLSNDRPVVCPLLQRQRKHRRFNRSGPTNAVRRRPTKKGSARINSHAEAEIGKPRPAGLANTRTVPPGSRRRKVSQR